MAHLQASYTVADNEKGKDLNVRDESRMKRVKENKK